MSNLSPTNLFTQTNTVFLITGMVLGTLGHYAVRWLKEYYSPSKTFSSPFASYHTIFYLTKDGTRRVQAYSIPEFKKAISTEELNTLRRSVGWQERSEETWQKVLERSAIIVCVKNDNRLVAFGSFIGDGRNGQIRDVHVDRQYQKQRIGTIVMNHLITRIKSQKYFSANLFSDEDNANISKFYAKFGFESKRYGMEAECSRLVQYEKPPE